MITGFVPRIAFPRFSRPAVLKTTVLFLRIASLGAAVAYAVAVR